MADEFFDIDAFEDDGIRIQYQTLRRRFLSLGQSVKDAYGLDGLPIETGFVRSSVFNASVEQFPNRYLIRMTTAVPALLMMFFDKLLSEPEVMPWISSEDPGSVGYDIAFSFDPRDLTQRTDMSVRTNPIRAFASYTLADLATTFMYLHELGHILAGHLKARHASGQSTLVEEFNHSPGSAAAFADAERDLSQLQEYEADAIAAYLTSHFVHEIVEDVAKNERTAAVFGPAERAGERALSLALMALYGLFAYVRGQTRHLNVTSSHPDPLVRALYCRDILFQVAAAPLVKDVDWFLDELQARFDELNKVLEKLGLLDPIAVTDDGVDLAAEEAERLKKLKQDSGYLTAKYSFITWDG